MARFALRVCLLAATVQPLFMLQAGPSPMGSPELFYLSEWDYADFKALVGPPPPAGSAEQQVDEQLVRDIQRARTPEDCEEARRSDPLTLRAFFGPATKILSEDEYRNFQVLFDKTQHDVEFFLWQLKADFSRKRPFRQLSGIEPCVPKVITASYPSEHALMAQLFAQILADAFPDRKELLDMRVQKIAQGRLISGLHYSTDLRAGKVLGEAMASKFFMGPGLAHS